MRPTYDHNAAWALRRFWPAVVEGSLKPGVILSGLVIFAALGGLLATLDRGVEDPGVSHRVARAGNRALELSPLQGWTETTNVPSLDGMEFQNPVVLEERVSGSRLVAGLLPARSPSLLPREFVRRLHMPLTRPETTMLGSDLKAYRFAGLSPGTGPGLVDVYVVPTTAGVATIACVAGPGLAEPHYDCWRNAATLKLRGGRPLRLGPDAAFRQRLPGAISALDRARDRARTQLATQVPLRQAAAASKLAAAYRDEATSLAPLAPASRPWSRALVRGLADAGRAYRRVVAALRSADTAAFRTGRGAIHARERHIAQLLNPPHTE